MTKTKVHLHDLQIAVDFLDAVNNLKLEEIEWVKDGSVIEVDADKIENWSKFSLSNKHFAEMYGMIE